MGSNDSDIAQLHRELELVVRPPVKAMRDQRSAYREQATCRFRAMVDAACTNGWSLRSLAREAHCTVRHLIDCYEGKRAVPGWMFEALPREARVEEARLLVDQLRRATNA